MTQIETAIQKLSLDEQRMIALHIGERLSEAKCSGSGAMADEGIRSLPPYATCEPHSQSRGPKLNQSTETEC